MKKTLEKAAKAGRFGDDRLIHVSQSEIDGLASLVPGGRLPVNPETGLHEAFFFIPALAGLAAAAAPAAAAAGTLAAGTAAAAAPALAAAAPLAAGTAAAGAGAAGAGLGALGAAAAPTAATAAMPALTGATTALAPTATAGAAGLPSIMAGTPLAGVKAAAAPLAAKTAAAPLAAAVSPATTGAIGTGVLPGAGTAATLADAAGAAGVTGMTPSTGGGLASLFGGLDGGKLLQYGALGAMMLPRGGGGGSSKEDKRSAKDIGAKQYDRGDQAEAPDMGNQGGITREFNYFPNARYYAEGGLASLDKKSGGGDDNELIDATVAALQGQAPNPDAIIQQFIQTFGPDALKDLIAQVQGGGQSDGMSDSIPAQINGGLGSIAPAQISEGEYVVPADVVSHLGNGSTEAGARQLKGMEQRVRSARGADAPTAINPMAALPA